MAKEFLASHGIDIDAEMEKIQFACRDGRSSPSITAANNAKDSISVVRGARLPRRPLLWDLHLDNGRISDIRPHDFNSACGSGEVATLQAQGRLVAPSLCHAHIHIDKCFLLQDPRFQGLQIVQGDFQEAMSLTSAAKARFSPADLLRRGRQLVEESVQAGVTAMRAFVEVDGVVGYKCLDAGVKLKQEYARRCTIQLVCFAQLPLFSGPDGGNEVRRLMEDAASNEEVDVLGSTPYVEEDEEKQKENVRWIASLAQRTGKPLDLHLDYNLDQSTAPLVWDVLRTLKAIDWNRRSSKTNVVLGHCTRLTFFTDLEWQKLKDEIGDLPISFVGLPTSDLFMMRTEQRYRGSLHIPKLINKHRLNGAIAINNVCNAFTPQGSCDPLTVASLGVGLYSAGTQGDAELLYECVSERAKSALGFEDAPILDLQQGMPADLVVFPLAESRWRSRKSIAEVVYDPPPCTGRVVIKEGRVVSGGIGPKTRAEA